MNFVVVVKRIVDNVIKVGDKWFGLSVLSMIQMSFMFVGCVELIFKQNILI